MALSKVDYNSMNVTPAASKAIKFNSSNNGLETGDMGGSLVLLSTQTASSSATIDFTSDIDSTYKEYIFKFINIHPATYQARFAFQADTGTNTNYNQAMTTTWFYAYHQEDGNSGSSAYFGDADLANSTSFKNITWNVDNSNDDNVGGSLHLFDPSNTTFVKHFMSNTQFNYGSSSESTENVYSAGYFNTTVAITRVRFKFTSGNIDSGTIKMYGVS